ncbi:MAG: hypothetical protein ACNA7J_01010 [Wenzhouxiangella sp.]
MSKKLILSMVLLAASLPVGAGVVLNIDGQDYPGTQVLRYGVSSMVFHVDFLGLYACSGSTISSPDGLTLDIDGQLYALSGPITLELAQNSDRLVMTTDSGDLTCGTNRIFHDSFIPI